MQDSITFKKTDGVAWIRLNRPEALNALNQQMRDLMEDAIDSVALDTSLHAVVVTGNGKAFCAGADIAEFESMGSRAAVKLSQGIGAFHDRLARLPVPVVAAINGHCLGGGLELALACDIRVASSAAKFGFPEPRLGLITGSGGLPRLARLIGTGPARFMALTAEIVPAARAYDLGILGKVFPTDDFETELAGLLTQLSVLSPFALTQIKLAMIATEETSLTSAITEEARRSAACMEGPDIGEGIKAFAEKRSPRFTRSNAAR